MTVQTSETNPAAARVQVIPAPIASPGNCILCGKSQHDEGFADARLDFEFYGTLYLCADCVGDFARAFGYISPKDAVILAQRVKYLEQELETHRDALLALESSVEELTNYRMLRSVITDTNNDDSMDESNSDSTSQGNETSSGSIITLPKRTAETESDISESNSEPGPNDVPGSTSDDGDLPIIGL